MRLKKRNGFYLGSSGLSKYGLEEQLPELNMAKAHDSVFLGPGTHTSRSRITPALPRRPQYVYGKPEVTDRGPSERCLLGFVG